jgi:hypothetical protein
LFGTGGDLARANSCLMEMFFGCVSRRRVAARMKVKFAQSLEDSSMFAWFWPLDFSFSGMCFCMLLFLVWTAWSIKETAKDAAKAAKKIAENETVRETGKGILAILLESVFKK